MPLLITGATGRLGRLVVEQLLAAGVPAGDIIATGRPTDKIKDLEAGYAEALTEHGVPELMADMIAETDVAVAHGARYTASGDLTALTGRSATTLSAAVGAALSALDGN
jgi:NAD(P)H dehydrogenase (quinone)